MRKEALLHNAKRIHYSTGLANWTATNSDDPRTFKAEFIAPIGALLQTPLLQADKIIVLKEGRTAEAGLRDDLTWLGDHCA